jgi:hypothetical protein
MEAIIEKLATLDPMAEGYQGNVSCFFCGAFEEVDGSIIHAPDCIWLLAKQEVKKTTAILIVDGIEQSCSHCGNKYWEQNGDHEPWKCNKCREVIIFDIDLVKIPVQTEKM